MLNLPGDLIRRAATNVTSTVSSVSGAVTSTVSSGVSTVASVATGSSRRRSLDRNSAYQDSDQILLNAKEKYAFSLKCTPNKDAITTANLAIRSGYVMKRNEQGVYHKKFVCLVPHSFLYYFDSETSDTPRGVIDLELYTNLSREDNTLKVATSDEDKLRVFYFEDEDHENLNNWLTSIMRDRYHTICDERNAYQQMQIDMTGVLDSASIVRKSTEAEKETLESDLIQSNRSFAEALSILQTMLVIVGITEEDMSKLSDVNKIGYALKKGIIELKSGLEKKYDESLEIIEQMSKSHETAVEELQDKLRIEQQIRKELELNMIIERKEAEARMAQNQSEIDNAMMNFQIAVTSRTAAETKNSTLSEQKKVLVKEVKQLRKKLDDTNESMELLKGLNEKLCTATAELQEQLKAANEALAIKSEAEAKEREDVAALLAESSKVINNIHNEAGNEEVKPSAPEHVQPQQHHTQSSFAKLTTKFFSGGSSHHDGERSSTHGSVDNDHEHTGHRTLSDHSTDDTKMNWEASPSHLKDLGWLSPEQNKLVDRRMSETVHEDSPTQQATQSQAKGSHRSASMYMYASAMSLMGSSSGGGVAAESSPTPATATNQPTPELHPKESRRSSLGMMASMFTGGMTGGTNSNKDKPPVHTAVETNETDPAFSQLIEDDPERLPSAMRLKCLRCEGSVEGPKYSTCKCAVPALTPEDLGGMGSSISMFTGFMSKGSSAVAGGIMKAGNAAMTYSTGSGGGANSATSVGIPPRPAEGSINSGGALDEELATSSVTSEELPRASFSSLLDSETLLWTVEARLLPINFIALRKLSLDTVATPILDSNINLLIRGGVQVKKKNVKSKKSNEMVDKVKSFVADVEPVTKAYAALILFCSLVTLLGLPGPAWFNIDASRLVEVWRPFTAAAYFGEPSLSLLNSLYFLLVHGQTFEKSKGSGEYAWFLLVQTLLLSGLGLWLGFPFHAHSMISAIVYLSSREHPFEKMMFQFGIPISSWQLPLCMMAIDCLAQKSLAAAWPHVLGIFSGHVYHFANTVWPALGGTPLLTCPKWFKKRFGDRPQPKVGNIIQAKEKEDDKSTLNRSKSTSSQNKKLPTGSKRKLGSA